MGISWYIWKWRIAPAISWPETDDRWIRGYATFRQTHIYIYVYMYIYIYIYQFYNLHPGFVCFTPHMCWSCQDLWKMMQKFFPDDPKDGRACVPCDIWIWGQYFKSSKRSIPFWFFVIVFLFMDNGLSHMFVCSPIFLPHRYLKATCCNLHKKPLTLAMTKRCPLVH